MANNYNDALERAKQAIIDCGSNASRKEMIYGIFPELRENEEDKIKDTLHSIICRAINDQGSPYEERVFVSTKVLPYVEKLQEHMPAEWSDEDEVTVTSIIDVLKRFEHQGATDIKIDWLKSLPERFK